MAKKQATIPREWLRSHQNDQSLIDSVAVGALASEVLRLRQEVTTLEARALASAKPVAPPEPEHLGGAAMAAAMRAAAPSAATEHAETEDDAEATAVYFALEYLDRYGLACLWLNREQRKAPLLSVDVLANAVEEHADRLREAQRTTPEVPRDTIGSPLAAELYLAVRGTYLQALQPSIDEAAALIADLKPFRQTPRPESAEGHVGPDGAKWRVVAHTSGHADYSQPQHLHVEMGSDGKVNAVPMTHEKARESGKIGKP